jgi:tRNA dimethylallyltransferase
VRWLVVDPGERLHEQIAGRLDAMLAGAWQEEVRGLMNAVDEAAPAWQACGYGTVRQLVRGTLEPGPAREAILIATRQYAKRQRTWFRHQLSDESVTRVNPHDASSGEIVERWWRAAEESG